MTAVQHFKQKPFRHQAEDFEKARGQTACALLHEMGCGKSAIALALLHAWYDELDACLIVAPKSVCLTWVRDQIPEHLLDWETHYRVGLWRPEATQKQANVNSDMLRGNGTLPILVMNYDALSSPRGYGHASAFLHAHLATLVILDESTRIKNPRALRTKRLLQLRKLTARRLILTGMPVTQSPLDLYCQYEFLDPKFLESTNYFAFKCRYARLKKRYINGRQFDEIVGYQRLDELQRLALAHGYRRLKAECLDLPPKLYQLRQVELSDKQRHLYEQMRDDAVIALEGSEAPITAPLVLTQLLRLRQVLAGFIPSVAMEDIKRDVVYIEPNYRLDELLEVCEEVSGKVIIWTSFLHSLWAIGDALEKAYGFGSVGRFSGATNQETRQAIIEQFQDPASKLRFFVGQVHTGGVGITLTAAETVIYYDHDWSLEARAQSEDRAHRIGQTKSVTYVSLVARGTIDEDVLTALVDKRSLADAVTGDGWHALFKKKEVA